MIWRTTVASPRGGALRPRGPAPAVGANRAVFNSGNACEIRCLRGDPRLWAAPRGRVGQWGALALLGAVVWLTGCGRWQVTSSHRPPASPLLELPAPRTQPVAASAPIAARPAADAPRPAAAAPVAPSAAGKQAPRPATGPKRPAPAPEPAVVTAPLPADLPAERVAVVRALEQLVGQTTLEGRPATDLALVRASFAPLGGPAAAADGLDGLYRGTAPRGGVVAPGDLLFFERVAEVPAVCVVRRLLPDGALEAGCVTRKAVRWVRVHLHRPHQRREGGAVVNTFLRPRRRHDPPRARYLAGQLLREVRSAFPAAAPAAEPPPATVAAGR